MDEWHQSIEPMPEAIMDENGNLDEAATAEAKKKKMDRIQEHRIKSRVAQQSCMICKLADFGLSEVTNDQQQGRVRQAGSPGFVPPEVARAWVHNDVCQGRQSLCDEEKESAFTKENQHPEDHLRYKHDVYAFGVVCAAIFNRNEPYFDPDDPTKYPDPEDGANDYLEAVAQGWLPAPYFPDGICSQLKSQIEACLTEDPVGRPRFHEVRDALQVYVDMKLAQTQPVIKQQGDLSHKKANSDGRLGWEEWREMKIQTKSLAVNTAITSACKEGAAPDLPAKQEAAPRQSKTKADGEVVFRGISV